MHVRRTPVLTLARLAPLALGTALACSDATPSSVEIPDPAAKAKVGAVVVSPGAVSVAVGAKATLSASVQDQQGKPLSGRAVAWRSANTLVAAVSAAGEITGVTSGVTTVVATSGGVTSAAVAVTVTPRPVSAVRLSPDSLSIHTGDTARLVATALDEGGSALPGRLVAWASSDTTVARVSQQGLVTAVAVGGANVTAASGGRTAVARVTVTASPQQPPPPTASVTVTPATATVAIGQTLQLAATVKDAGGIVLPGRTVSWQSSNSAVAAVSATGLVSALAAGTATITATSEGKSGTAGITVPAPAPASVDTVFAETFESGNLAAWQDGVDPSRHRVITDAGLARSGSRLLEMTFPAGSDGGWLTRWFMPGYDSLYVRYYVRLDPNWQGSTKLLGLFGSRIDNQWSAMGQAGVCPNGSDYFATVIVQDQQQDLRFYSYFPAMARDPDGKCWGRYGDGRGERYMPPLALSRGEWHRIEFWVRLNTPGQNNAEQRFWVDGVLRGEWSGFSFRNTRDLRLNSVQITGSMWGAPQTQKVYVDDLLVTKAIPAR